MNASIAISRIRFMLDVGGSDGFTSADKEALNMAVNALSAEINAQPKTNGDRLRRMSDEQLAEFLCFSDCTTAEKECPQWDNEHCDGDCPKHFYEWLRQEVHEDAGTN